MFAFVVRRPVVSTISRGDTLAESIVVTVSAIPGGDYIVKVPTPTFDYNMHITHTRPDS